MARDNKNTWLHFQRVACLGLPPPAAIAALVEVMHEIVPSAFYRMCFCDSAYRVTNGYTDNPECFELFTPFLAEYDGKVDYWPSLESCLRRGPGVGYYLPYLNARFYRSSLYNDIERRMGTYHQLDAVIGDEQRVYGSIIAARERGTPFSAEDQRRLAAMIPYLAHAISGTDSGAEAAPGTLRRQGVLILDTDARTVMADSTAHYLAWMMDNAVAFSGWMKPKMLQKPATIARLVERLVAIDNGRVSAPPTLSITNAWGRFDARADWLSSTEAYSERRHIRVVIDHREPASVSLHRRLRPFELTPRQYQLCLLLLEGAPRSTIGARLGVKAWTVHEYVRGLYRKVGVHSRHELRTRLETD
ncbi:MAG: helix-turn-helix transcriptional regulator [Gammaproteobacteria bacterium]